MQKQTDKHTDRQAVPRARRKTNRQTKIHFLLSTRTGKWTNKHNFKIFWKTEKQRNKQNKNYLLPSITC